MCCVHDETLHLSHVTHHMSLSSSRASTPMKKKSGGVGTAALYGDDDEGVGASAAVESGGDAISASARLHWMWIQGMGIRCPPQEELYDSMRSGVLLCEIINKLERREFVKGIEMRPKARAQYVHNCKRWVA